MKLAPDSISPHAAPPHLPTTHPPAPPVTTAWDFQERRHHPQVVRPTIACRVCSSLTTLEPGRIKLAEGNVYHRCPHCSGASRVRGDDARMLESPPSVPATARRWPHPLAARVGVAGILILIICVVAWLVAAALVIMWLVEG
jgi:hypothetical protein